MAKEWCVDGLTLKFTINGTQVFGTEEILSTPSDKTKVNNKGIYYDVFKVKLSGSTYGSWSQVSPVTFNINCGAQYSKEHNKPIMLKEDNVTVNGVLFKSGDSTTTFSIKCEVDDPGQDVVKEL